MKKMLSLAALMAVLTGCTIGEDANLYGSESMAEESLGTDTTELNDSYLLAAASFRWSLPRWLLTWGAR